MCVTGRGGTALRVPHQRCRDKNLVSSVAEHVGITHATPSWQFGADIGRACVGVGVVSAGEAAYFSQCPCAICLHERVYCDYRSPLSGCFYVGT